MADPTAQEMLSAYLNAEKQIVTAGAQEVHIADRVFKAIDLPKIRQQITYWRRCVNASNGRPSNSLADFT